MWKRPDKKKGGNAQGKFSARGEFSVREEPPELRHSEQGEQVLGISFIESLKCKSVFYKEKMRDKKRSHCREGYILL